MLFVFQDENKHVEESFRSFWIKPNEPGQSKALIIVFVFVLPLVIPIHLSYAYKSVSIQGTVFNIA